MIEENQMIDEMAEMLDIIKKAREAYANDVTDHTEDEYIREGLLDAGYRKQKQGWWETTPRYNPDTITAYTHTCSE